MICETFAKICSHLLHPAFSRSIEWNYNFMNEFTFNPTSSNGFSPIFENLIVENIKGPVFSFTLESYSYQVIEYSFTVISLNSQK